MRWVLTTALGILVEPEVNRNLVIVSGPVAAMAASTAAVGGRGEQAAKGVTSRGLRACACGQHHLDIGGDRGRDGRA